VDTYEDRFRGRDIAEDEGGMFVRIDGGAVGVEDEIAPLGREGGGGNALDEPLAPDAVTDELVDGDDPEAVASGEALDLGEPHHGAIRVHELAKDAAVLEASEAAEVDGGLGVTSADENAALTGAEGIDVARHDEVAGDGGGIGQDMDSAGTVVGGDAGGNTEAGVDGDGEGSAVPCLVVADHKGDTQVVEALSGEGDADNTTGVTEHEADSFLSDELSRDGQVALVFTALVVDDDEKAAALVLFDGLFNRGEAKVARAGAFGSAVLFNGLYIRLWLQGGRLPSSVSRPHMEARTGPLYRKLDEGAASVVFQKM